MATAIVYYSLNGNSELVANRIAERIGADLIRIEPQKAYPDKGASKFIWGGKAAMMSEKPALKPYTFDAERYDRVIFGFPVWASRVTPPIRTFIEENRSGLEGKSIAAFVCQTGGGGDKCLIRLKELLGTDDLEAEEIFYDPKDKPSAENENRLDLFCGKLKK